jgi:addiction module HigA family antidote
MPWPSLVIGGLSRKGSFNAHPGEILNETLHDLGLSMNQLALAIGVPANRISAIVSETRGITGETALRLARYFGTRAEYWINMQARYNLEVARDEFDAAIKQIKPRTVLGESYAHR